MNPLKMALDYLGGVMFNVGPTIPVRARHLDFHVTTLRSN